MSRAIKKITRPVSKVFDKIIPNEIKPALPYLAAVAPFAAPALFGAGAAGIGSISGLGATASRAALSGLLNLGSQLAQEGSEGEFNPLQVALSAGTGALTSPTAAAQLRGMQTGAQLGDVGTEFAERTLLGKARDFGLESLAKGSEYLAAGASPTATLGQAVKAATIPVGTEATNQAYIAAQKALEQYERDLADFNKTQAMAKEASDAERVAAITASMTRAGFGQSDINDALRQLNLFADGGSVSYTDYGRSGVIYKDEKGNPISKEEFFRRVDEEEMREEKEPRTLEDILENPEEVKRMLEEREGKRFGGIMAAVKALKKGGAKLRDKLSRMTDDVEVQTSYGASDAEDTVLDVFLKPKSKKGKKALDELVMEGSVGKFDDGGYFVKDSEDFIGGAIDKDIKASGVIEDGMNYRSFKEGAGMSEYGVPYGGYDSVIEAFTNRPKKADGGIMNLEMGGMPAEMDMRVGGFVPIGRKERADDVPARLSKNEFVMTADAVRGMGQGNMNRGAQRMYDIMNAYEAIGRRFS